MEIIKINISLLGQIDLNEIKGMNIINNNVYRAPGFYEKNKLCVKRTPICPENYCLNNGVCVVINKELTCDCPDFFFGDLCEYEIDTSNYNELSKFFEETVDLINENDTVIHNQSIFITNNENYYFIY